MASNFVDAGVQSFGLGFFVLRLQKILMEIFPFVVPHVRQIGIGLFFVELEKHPLPTLDRSQTQVFF